MLEALNDRCLVRKDEAPKQSGSIVIPDSAKDSLTTCRGLVLSVGSKVEQIHVGDRVVFNKYHGLDVADGNEVLLSIKEEELLAKEPAAALAAVQ